MKKSIFARTLLLFAVMLFLLQGGIGFWMVQFSAWEHKREMQRKNHENTQVISLSENELAALSWEDEHEFEYHGKMYDVVQTSKDEHGNTVLEVVQDDLEEELISFLDDLVNQSQKKQSSNFISFLKTTCLKQDVSFVLASNTESNFAEPTAFYLGTRSTFMGTEIERPPLSA